MRKKMNGAKRNAIFRGVLRTKRKWGGEEETIVTSQKHMMDIELFEQTFSIRIYAEQEDETNQDRQGKRSEC
jgi:hypothetical protein